MRSVAGKQGSRESLTGGRGVYDLRKLIPMVSKRRLLRN
jgi:hypothetical protein